MCEDHDTLMEKQEYYDGVSPPNDGMAGMIVTGEDLSDPSEQMDRYAENMMVDYWVNGNMNAQDNMLNDGLDWSLSGAGEWYFDFTGNICTAIGTGLGMTGLALGSIPGGTAPAAPIASLGAYFVGAGEINYQIADKFGGDER